MKTSTEKEGKTMTCLDPPRLLNTAFYNRACSKVQTLYIVVQLLQSTNLRLLKPTSCLNQAFYQFVCSNHPTIQEYKQLSGFYNPAFNNPQSKASFHNLEWIQKGPKCSGLSTYGPRTI